VFVHDFTHFTDIKQPQLSLYSSSYLTALTQTTKPHHPVHPPIIMDEPKSNSTSHAQAAMIRIATNETSHTQDDAARNVLDPDDQNQKDDVKVEVGDVEVQTPVYAVPVNEKVMLQDQTNLLPLKQLLIVFAGLSCALFCKPSLFSLRHKS
jgi:hypothetical protein